MAQVVGTVQEVAAPGVAVVGTAVLLEERHIPTGGAAFEVAWRDVSGATDVEVEGASLSLYPLAGGSPGRSLSTLLGAVDGTEAVVAVPDGPRAIRSFYLSDFDVFFDGDWRTVRDGGDLPGGWRVAVSVPQGGGFSAPAYAVPPLELNPGVIPTMLGGAWLEDRVLHLPDVEAERFRLQVLSGDFPDGLRPERFRVDSISARAAPEPVGLEAVDASGQTVWQQDGRLGGPATIDLKAALSRTLEQAVAAGAGPTVAFEVRAETSGDVRTAGVSATGRVIRRVEEKLTVRCEGDDRPVPVPGPPLDARAPHRASADVVVRHHGLRLHPLSDAVPDRPGDLTGPVLTGSAAVVRSLPPEALRDEELRRIGLVAVVREPVDVSVRVLEVVGGAPAGPLATAQATVSVEPLAGFAAARPRVVWLDLPDALPVDRSIAIEASVSRGRLHWVARDDGSPRARFAVTVADPAGAEVRVAGRALTLTGPRTERLGQALPAGAFAGGPLVASTDQFCDVVLTHLTLEYMP